MSERSVSQVYPLLYLSPQPVTRIHLGHLVDCMLGREHLQSRGRVQLVHTFAGGFIARILARRLIENSHCVVILASNRDQALDVFASHAIVIAELTCLHATERFDAVINLSGRSLAGDSGFRTEAIGEATCCGGEANSRACVPGAPAA